MASSAFVTNTVINPYITTISPVTPASNSNSTVAVDSFNLSVVKTENNNSLCRFTNNCNGISSGGGSDTGSVAPGTPFKDTLNSMITNVTFETIYKNLASFPNVIDRTNRRLVYITYTIDTLRSIVATIDRTVKNVVTITLTGDTGYTKSLVKTIIMDGKNIIDISYKLGN